MKDKMTNKKTIIEDQGKYRSPSLRGVPIWVAPSLLATAIAVVLSCIGCYAAIKPGALFPLFKNKVIMCVSIVSAATALLAISLLFVRKTNMFVFDDASVEKCCSNNIDGNIPGGDESPPPPYSEVDPLNSANSASETQTLFRYSFGDNNPSTSLVMS